MQNPIAVSTWSLHHHLYNSDILQLPQELAQHGYFRCEICHFHLKSQEPDYLQAVSRAFADAGVMIQTLLIDDGDPTNPATLERDKEWMAKWIEAGAILKAEHVRVIAGKALPTPETLALSIAGLRDMVSLGEMLGVKVVTENWFDLLSTPAAVHHVLDNVPGLGFMADTGNWSGPTKYEDLASIFARANLCHAKAHFDPGLQLDEKDFSQCLAAAKLGGYKGPMTLIFADDGDEWDGLDVERCFILSIPTQ